MGLLVSFFVSFFVILLILCAFMAFSDPEKKETERKGFILTSFFLCVLIGLISEAYIQRSEALQSGSADKNQNVEITEKPEDKIISHDMELKHYVIKCSKIDDSRNFCAEYEVLKIIKE